ncbi:MFS transporter [Clostridia bacterium]|nr:MFS transporter [Clostridia bacterium]
MTEITDRKQYDPKVQRTTLVVAMITNFINPFALTALNIAVPTIGKEFHIVATHLTWIVLSFTFTTVLLTIPFGRIADIRGREPILKIGILLVGVASACNIFAPNMALFFLLRALQGAGAAMVFATNVPIAIDAYPASRRGWVLGVTVAAVYLGGACGPVLGGLITHYFGWRGIFVLIAILSGVAFSVAMIWLPRKEKLIPSQGLSPGSIVLFAISIGLVAYGLTTLMQNIWSYFILAAGAVFSVIFVRHEFRTKTPVIDVRLFRDNVNFSLSNIAALLNYAAIFAIAYLMSIYLQLVKGYGADVSGLILICQPIVQAVVSPIAGKISDRRSPYAMASLGMTFCAVALVMLAFIDTETSIYYMIGALLLAGFGFGVFSSPNTSVIMGSVDRKDYGMASSVSNTARTFGQVACMAIITIIMNVVIGNRAIENAPISDIVLDMHISFLVVACICVTGIFFSLRRKSDGVKK